MHPLDLYSRIPLHLYLSQLIRYRLGSINEITHPVVRHVQNPILLGLVGVFGYVISVPPQREFVSRRIDKQVEQLCDVVSVSCSRS